MDAKRPDFMQWDNAVAFGFHVYSVFRYVKPCCATYFCEFFTCKNLYMFDMGYISFY